MMSSSRLNGFSEGNGPIPFDLSLQTLFGYWLLHDIHFAIQHSCEACFQRIEPAEKLGLVRRIRG